MHAVYMTDAAYMYVVNIYETLKISRLDLDHEILRTSKFGAEINVKMKIFGRNFFLGPEITSSFRKLPITFVIIKTSNKRFVF